MKNKIQKYDVNTTITKANYIKAADYAKKIKTAQKDIESILAPALKAAHNAHKTIKGTINDQLAKYNAAEAALKDKFGEFHKKNRELKIDSVAFVDTLEPVIVDEELIPSEYMMSVPNIRLIKEEVKKKGKLFNCPGIKVLDSTGVRFYAQKD